MSWLKVQTIQTSSILQRKGRSLIQHPHLNFEISSMAVLNYEVDTLVEVIRIFLEEDECNLHMTRKSLQVMSMSLNDRALVQRVEELLRRNIDRLNKVYQLFCIWSSFSSNISSAIAKMTPPNALQIINLLFQAYFLHLFPSESLLFPQLPNILKIIHPQTLLETLKRAYFKNGTHFKQLLLKSIHIHSLKNSQMNLMVEQLIQFAMKASQIELAKILEEYQENKVAIEFLFSHIPSMSSTFIKHIKVSLNEQNITSLSSTDVKVGTIIKSAAKEWVNESDNFWKVVDGHYFSGGQDVSVNRERICELGKELIAEGLFVELITIKYIHWYFQNQLFRFDQEDSFLSTRNQPFVDVYKAVSHSKSQAAFNLIILSTHLAPKSWLKTNPFLESTTNKPFNQFILSFQNFFTQTQAKYLKNNKTISMSFSTFLVKDKLSGKQIYLTFQQLKQSLQKNIDFTSLSFQTEYSALTKAKPKSEDNKRQHQIIIEAKLVKLLKKKAVELKICDLVVAGYSEELIESALRRLVVKGFAEQNQSNKTFKYVA